jgi:hypothetical protein
MFVKRIISTYTEIIVLFILNLIIGAYVLEVVLFLHKKIYWKAVACLSPMIMIIILWCTQAHHTELYYDEEESNAQCQLIHFKRKFRFMQPFCILTSTVAIIIVSSSIHQMHFVYNSLSPFGCLNNKFDFFLLESMTLTSCNNYSSYIHTSIAINSICLILSSSLIIIYIYKLKQLTQAASID